MESSVRRTVVLLCIGILFLTLQTTWLTFPYVQNVRPDLLLLLTLFLGLFSSTLSGGLLAFLLGYLMDLFSGNGVGFFALSRPLLFYGTQLFKDRLFLESFSSRSLFVFLLALGEGIFFLLLSNLFRAGSSSNPVPPFFKVFIPQCLSTALLSSFFFFLLRKGITRLETQPRTGMGRKR